MLSPERIERAYNHLTDAGEVLEQIGVDIAPLPAVPMRAQLARVLSVVPDDYWRRPPSIRAEADRLDTELGVIFDRLGGLVAALEETGRLGEAVSARNIRHGLGDAIARLARLRLRVAA